jgi:hypothetical protein
MKKWILVIGIVLPFASCAMQEEEGSTVKQLLKKVGNCSVWKKNEGEKQAGVAVFDDYTSETPYESWQLLIDQRGEQLEEVLAEFPEGKTIRRLISLQNFCWVKESLFGDRFYCSMGKFTPGTLLRSVSRVYKSEGRYYTQATNMATDGIQIEPHFPCLSTNDCEDMLWLKAIPGTKKFVLCCKRKQDYMLQISESSWEGHKNNLPIYRVAVGNESAAWTYRNENSRLCLRVWEKLCLNDWRPEKEVVFDAEVRPDGTDVPLAWRGAPNRASILADGNKCTVSFYAMNSESNKLAVTKSETIPVLTDESIFDVAFVPETPLIALFTQSHVQLMRSDSEKSHWWKTIHLPVCPSQFSFSPDGGTLAVTGITQAQEENNKHHLYAIDLATGYKTENLADSLELKDMDPTSPAMQVAMANDGSFYVAWQKNVEEQDRRAYLNRQRIEQHLLPLDFNALLVLKALHEMHEVPESIRYNYRHAIEESKTFKKCSAAWQHVFTYWYHNKDKSGLCSLMEKLAAEYAADQEKAKVSEGKEHK